MNADRKGVALALIATFLVLVADEIFDRNRAPKPRRVVAFTAVFLILGMLSEIQSAAKFAKWFSVLVLIGTVYAVGPELYPKLTRALAGTKPTIKPRKVVTNKQH